MELVFAHSQKVTDGRNPAAYHSPDNIMQVFYTDGDGRIWTVNTDTPFGNFSDRVFGGGSLAASDAGVEFLKVAYLPRMNLWSVWKVGNKHRMAVFILKQETNKYLVDGGLSFRDDDATVPLSLTLENPAGIIAAEDAVDTPPGTRINVFFSIGDSSRVHLGVYYLDSIETEVGNPQVSLSARNATGKLLKDQTFDEKRQYTGTITGVLSEILDDAGIIATRIEQSGNTITVEFPPNMNYYEGIRSVLTVVPGWEMKEDVGGTIVIGSPSFIQLSIPPGTYHFERGRDCFSRKVTRDDKETYSRVCVHDKEFAVAVWQDVQFMEGWNLPARKTLYVEAPDGTTLAQATARANYLAGRLAKVGVVEAFTAPFRPQLQPSDEAEITEPGKTARVLGIITQVDFAFGRSGFFTSFTVDSGGMIRKPRIRDYIEEISGKKDVGQAKIT